jgi:phosphoribosylformimino-5-aminoimidazole carboxamide ribotide isomerase
MLLIPAIDLKDGHCVRLKQGDMTNPPPSAKTPPPWPASGWTPARGACIWWT